MNIFSVDFTVGELQIMRQSLDAITISGRDAKVIANLQMKLESEIASIQQMLQEAEQQKQAELAKAIEGEKKKLAKA